MKLNPHSLPTLVFLSLAFSVPALSQMVSISPFDIAPPTVLNDVKALRAASPKMTPAELVDAANVVLAKQGIPFTFTFDDATCDAIDKSIKSLKNAPPRVNLKTKLRSVGGEPANLTLPPADFTNNECGKCSVTLPVLEINEKEFVALMLGQNIKFHLPGNFTVAEAFTITSATPSDVKTKWRMPFRTKPIGVSFDGNVLYLELSDPELKDLSLAVFGEGVFQFATREEGESSGKAIERLHAPYTRQPRTTSIFFENRGAKHHILYAEACAK